MTKKEARAIVDKILASHTKSGFDQFQALIELAANAVYAAAIILDVNQPDHPTCPLCRAKELAAERAHVLAGAPPKQAAEHGERAVH